LNFTSEDIQIVRKVISGLLGRYIIPTGQYADVHEEVVSLVLLKLVESHDPKLSNISTSAFRLARRITPGVLRELRGI
jgi:hypothetical protein